MFSTVHNLLSSDDLDSGLVRLAVELFDDGDTLDDDWLWEPWQLVIDERILEL